MAATLHLETRRSRNDEKRLVTFSRVVNFLCDSLMRGKGNDCTEEMIAIYKSTSSVCIVVQLPWIVYPEIHPFFVAEPCAQLLNPTMIVDLKEWFSLF